MDGIGKMSNKRLYSDRDNEQFACLMSVSSSKSPKSPINMHAPHIQTRANYTDKDLEKFEKMFSAGFAPKVSTSYERKNRVSSELSNTTNISEESVVYKNSDKEHFDKLLISASAKTHTVPVSPGGKVGCSKFRSFYTEGDKEQFRQILSVATLAQKSSCREEHENGLGKKESYFTELSPASNETSSSVLSIERPGKGRIKLRYFE